RVFARLTKPNDSSIQNVPMTNSARTRQYPLRNHKLQAASASSAMLGKKNSYTISQTPTAIAYRSVGGVRLWISQRVAALMECSNPSKRSRVQTSTNDPLTVRAFKIRLLRDRVVPIAALPAIQ